MNVRVKSRDGIVSTLFVKAPQPPPAQKYSITVEEIDPPGSAIYSGVGEYDNGSTCTLQAVVSDGYEFNGWYSGGILISSDNPHQFTVTQKMEFALKTEPLGYKGFEIFKREGTNY